MLKTNVKTTRNKKTTPKKTKKNDIANPQSNLKRLSRSPKQTLKRWEASAYGISSWVRDTGLHVRAEVMAALDWLPAPERNEPQEFPASAAHFGQRPLPGPLGAKAAREKVHVF